MATAIAPIKKWKVQHEMIVHLHIAGYPAAAIAEKLGVTPVRVSQVLCDPQAKQIIRGVKNNLRQTLMDSVDDELVLLAEESVKRIGETLRYEDFSLGSDAKKHQDNLAMGVLKGVGFLPGEQEGIGKAVQKSLEPALAARLISALEASNEAEQIRQGTAETEIMEAEVVEISHD
jgi:hypothetical protein